MAEVTKNVEAENKLLLGQQHNYRQLCSVLTERHLEILNYLNYLQNTIEKISMSKENVVGPNYYSEKCTYESNILTYDKQIQLLTDAVQASQNRICDNEENRFKEQLKLLSNSIVDNNTLRINTNSIKNLNQNNVVGYRNETELANANSKLIFVPQMELLEVMDYNNSSTYSAASTTTTVAVPKQTNEKQSQCEYCGKFFNKHYISSHRRSHTGVRPYKCSFVGCNRTFTQTSSRNVHEKRIHNSGPTDLKCTYYGTQIQTANTGGTRKRSKKSGFVMPNNGYRHVCEHCGKAFAYKVAMKQHLALHGPKNFRCTFNNCNYASYWKHNLSLHLKRHHNVDMAAS